MKTRCPRCEKETDITGNPFRPFCSERCKLIDLGNWVSGSYRIHADPVNEEDDPTPEPQEDLSKK